MSAVDRLSAPVSIRMSRVVPGPPDVVWDVITDWEHSDDWMLEASDFAVTSPHREGVGVEAEATIRIAGITTRDRVRVTVWEPPLRLCIDHLGWVSGSAEMAITPVGQGSVVDWLERLTPPLGVLGGAGIRLFVPTMRRTFERDLRVLEGLVRARMLGRGAAPERS